MSAVRRRRPSWIRPREKNLSNYERNVRRILNPPPRTLADRLHVLLSRVENVWCQHVTQRELFRQLDALRDAMNHPARWPAGRRRPSSGRQPAFDVGLELPDGAQRGVDHGLGAGADEGVGGDSLSAAGHGLVRGGRGRCDGGAEDGEGAERDERGDRGHGVPPFLSSRSVGLRVCLRGSWWRTDVR